MRPSLSHLIAQLQTVWRRWFPSARTASQQLGLAALERGPVWLPRVLVPAASLVNGVVQTLWWLLLHVLLLVGLIVAYVGVALVLIASHLGPAVWSGSKRAWLATQPYLRRAERGSRALSRDLMAFAWRGLAALGVSLLWLGDMLSRGLLWLVESLGGALVWLVDQGVMGSIWLVTTTAT